MIRFFLCIVAFYCLLPTPCPGSELVRTAKVERKDIVQLYFTFDTPPRFSSTADNRRIDLIFPGSTLADGVKLPETDADIVKILPRRISDKLILSIFFRYRPQNYQLSLSDDRRVVFEVLLGNEYSKSYQELADRLKGLTVLDRTPEDLNNPYYLSPYTGDWDSFFVKYESPVTIRTAVRYNGPPFPVIRLLPPGGVDNLSVLDQEIYALADQGDWDQISAQLLQALQRPIDIEKKKLLALTFGESLARSNLFSEAYKQLYLLNDTYKDELIGSYAGYLLGLLLANNGDPYGAIFVLEKLVQAIGDDSPLRAYLHLTLVETALDAGDLTRLNTLLQYDQIAFPQDLKSIMELRQADYWWTIGQKVKAFSSYKLAADNPFSDRLPYSLNGQCSSLYDFKKYRQAASCYSRLAAIVEEKEQLGLIAYREGMARLKYTDPPKLHDNFGQIENAFPQTEAGWRAAIKRVDIDYIANRTTGEQALAAYQTIFDKAVLRSVREEALFKQALVYALRNDNSTALQLVQKLLREFQTGHVRIPAQALLIERLPGEIKRLVDNKQYIDALVLAKKNRDLFQKNWINSEFLVDIARAYQNVGIFDEAQRLYLYLIEIMPVDRREQFFLPMIESTYEDGNYTLVDDYAAQYKYNYPAGQYLDDILLYQVKALIADERIAEARDLLPEPLPSTPEFFAVAASLYFRDEQYVNTLKALQNLLEFNTELTENQTFMLAESYYQSDRSNEAEHYYLQMDASSPYFEHSRYRLAQLAREKGDEQKALSIFREIVEKGKSSQWKGFAERELEFKAMSQQM